MTLIGHQTKPIANPQAVEFISSMDAFICIIKDTSSCESELYSIVSTMGDAIFIRRCLEFILRVDISQVHFTDSSSARQLCNRQGVGKIRHLSGKGTLGSISGSKWRS